MEESRKLYEKWAIEVMQFTPDDLAWDERRNCYRDYVPHMAWKGWQASREAIEIEMPEPFKLAKSSSGLTYYYQDEIDAVLSCAGIKVKE